MTTTATDGRVSFELGGKEFRFELVPHDLSDHKINRSDELKTRVIAGERMTQMEMIELLILEEQLNNATAAQRARQRLARI